MASFSIEENIERLKITKKVEIREVIFEQLIKAFEKESDYYTAFMYRLEYLSELLDRHNMPLAAEIYLQCINSVKNGNIYLDDIDEVQWESIDDLLTEFKWVCTSLSDYANVPLDIINKYTELYKKQLNDAGHGLYSYYYLLMNQGRVLGDIAKADENYTKLQKAKKDSMADCDACVQDGIVSYMLFTNNWKNTLTAAEPILSGKKKCGEIPCRTYVNLVLPAYLNKNETLAQELFEKSYKLIAKKNHYAGFFGKLLVYKTITDINGALAFYEKHLKSSLARSSDYTAYEFSKGAAVLMNKLRKTKPMLTLALSKQFKLFRPDGKYKTLDLYNYHYGTAKKLADSFDERNGNKAYIKELEKEMGL